MVQRHINSMLLAHFLKLQSREGKLHKLTLEWWMQPQGESRQEKFVAWCECYKPEKHRELHQGVESLTHRTVLEGRNIQALVAKAGKAVGEHATQWRIERGAIQVQLDALVKKDEEDRLPMKALEVQKRRLEGEYLLRELATGGVLPGYGFPTDITTFETLNKDSREIQYRKDKPNREGREDNHFQRRELPSRDTVTALREYAPGARVVIDGLVYESAGITLNWHVPATRNEVSELQNIRQAWRCKYCGTSGTFVLAQKLEFCPECGTHLEFDPRSAMQYLEPAGFSVDIYAETHNDISLQTYMPVEQPWITAMGSWMPLANPQIGRFRASTQGSVFHYSSGAHRSGYALCLECGRTASIGDDGDDAKLPKIFEKPHSRLRGGKTNASWQCGGSHDNFKIKRGIQFGREYATDVLEVMLQGVDGQHLQDTKTAYTLAVALRRAIADHLGIDETELGCNTKEVREVGGQATRTLQIFDIRSAGYSSIVSPHLSELFRAARKNLECAAGCADACQSCLLTFDTRHQSDDLNRHDALTFLSEAWVDSLALAPQHQLLGRASRAEFQPLDEAIHRELNAGNVRKLFIYLNGEPSEWDLAVSPLRTFLRQASAKGDVGIYLISRSGNIADISRENAFVITSLQTLVNIEFKIGSSPQINSQITGEGQCIATVERADGSHLTWATSDASCANADIHWGVLQDGMLITAPTESPMIQQGGVSLPTFSAQGTQSFSISKELDGKGAGFGKRFWNHLNGGAEWNVLPKNQTLVAIEYTDRYLATPIACALLVEVLSAIKTHCESLDQWAVDTVCITSMMLDRGKPYRHRGNGWGTDWDTTDRRDQALKAAFEFSGMNTLVESKNKWEISHSRCLTLRLQGANGIASNLQIWFDQGLSYWNATKPDSNSQSKPFDMQLPPSDLGEALALIQTNVCGFDMPTQVFLELK